MKRIHFILESTEIQNLIHESVRNDVSKTILTTVFDQLMEEQRTPYINAGNFECSDRRTSQRNGHYERSWKTQIGTLEFKVPRTSDGKFSPTLFERYQRNEKAIIVSIFEMYIS